ncbi:2-polyprenylphenol 6-hydroxylase [Candidatus Photodesmus katoptron Akat1]|uniref:2-polyprenylphenol 6-hydroxylase n=1 Tax=Candidatus Photodesmus katoptron Akat1 TaxID=1236703 RepID=S3DLH2_9GAMM|nr:2-polyprenylphenol 6-hydroxylase [Candidatus Photodesmus katoptron Akat1]
MIFVELKRLYFIIKILIQYGIEDLLPKNKLLNILCFLLKSFFLIKNRKDNKSLGKRLYLAFQELGPIWIKLGQMISTRHDLFPQDIIKNLTMLQNKVAPFDGQLAKIQIEQALGGSLENWFTDFNTIPLASASIAQVHSAKLKKQIEK